MSKEINRSRAWLIPTLLLWLACASEPSTDTPTDEDEDNSNHWYELDFSHYADNAAFRDDGTAFYLGEDTNLGRIFLDETVDGSLGGVFSKSMRLDYAGASGCPSTTIGRNIANLPDQSQTELYIEVYLKFSSNFRVLGIGDGCSTPADFKAFFGRWTQSGRWQVKWGYQGAHAVMVGWPGDFADPNSSESERASAGAGASYWDGEWHRVRMHWRRSSTTSSADGVFTLEIDGEITFSATDITTNTMGSFWSLALGRNLDGMNTEDQSLWWGRLRIWVEDPDWGF